MLKGLGLAAVIACGAIVGAMSGTAADASALPALRLLADAPDHVTVVRGGGGGGGGGYRGGGGGGGFRGGSVGSYRGGSVSTYRGGGASSYQGGASGSYRAFSGGTRHHARPRSYPRTYFYTAPVVSYYGGYGSHCAYLAHQARSTGSPYWWRRYRYEC